jgi:soluble lytic murein transglycosylase-like protein
MSLFFESIKRFIRRTSRGSKKSILSKKLALVIMATLFLMASTPTEAQTPDRVSADQINIKLSTESANLLMNTDSIPRIVPGESAVQKEARLKAEAEKARLDALRRNTIAREYRKYIDPTDFEQIYINAGNRFGVEPMLLKAIHIVETGASGSTNRRNPSGAQGPMQFLPSTFRAHAVDGNGDGIYDINNVEDAIFSASRYLVDCGYPNLKKALWGYNPSNSYYFRVVNLAHSLGMK